MTFTRSDLMLLAILCLVTFVTAWIAVGAWIRFSLSRAIVDVPTGRSSHTRTTPRGGGVGIVGAILGGLLFASWRGLIPADLPVLVTWMIALAVAVVSFVDDVRSLSSSTRLACHLVAAAGVVVALGPFPGFEVPFLGTIHPPVAVMWFLTVMWIVGMTNVYNFMDGIDGIAAGQAIVTALAWGALGWINGLPGIFGMALLVAAPCAGFLIHNWSPARVFMGDVGSAFLGFVFGVLPLLALHDPSKPAHPEVLCLFAIFAVGPFIADGLLTFFRRLARGENVLQAHRSHLYQRLTIVGWPHAMVTLLYLGWGTLSVALGWVYLTGEDVERTCAASFELLLLGGMYYLVSSRERHRAAANSRRPATSDKASSAVWPVSGSD